jgi:hypothetical protein
VNRWSSFGGGVVLGAALTCALVVSFFDLRRPVAAAPGGAKAQAATPAASEGEVVNDVLINGRALTQRHKDEFVQRYGVAPLTGSYWYDAKSGLWGPAGRAAAGFLFPGHDFGALAADASSGRTSVFLNGREMPQEEVLAFGTLVGPIVPGRYWLDGTGNYGYEGFALPAGNLYVTAAALAGGGGGGGGGDNFWSSRFARGNSNADNSAGYVSVPGVGTVTYGM